MPASYLGLAALLVLTWLAGNDARWPVFVALTWAFHIAVDGLLEYGLKFQTASPTPTSER